jgi:Carboxypeptidase regulatory-like domain
MLFVMSTLALGQQMVDPPSGRAAIEGTVINAQNGRVIPRANVVLRSIKKPAEARSVRADGVGHFLFKSVAPGTYRLSADRQSFFSDSSRRAFQPRLEVSAGDHRQGILVRLLPTSVVTGQIVDENSDPMQHVQVKLLARAYRHGRMTLDTEGLGLTDDRGEYRIYDVRPGYYYLVAELTPGMQAKGMQVIETTAIVGLIQVAGAAEAPPERDIAYSALFYPDTTDFLRAEALPVNPGDEVHANFILFTKPSVSIHGKVINGITGDAAGNAAVAAYWSEYLEGSAHEAQVSTQDGTFEVRGLAPGLYSVRASFSSDGNTYTAQRTLEVGPAGLENVLLVGLPDSEIAGTVRVDNQPVGSSPVKRVGVEFQSRDTAAHSSATAALPSLRFQALLHPGDHYTVAARGLPQDYYLKAVRIANHDVEQNDVVVPDRRAAMELVLSPDGGHIEGQVFDERDQLVSGSVVLIPEASKRNFPDLFRKSGVDNKGQFILRGVPPGTYKLLAFDDVDLEELISRPEILKQYEDQGQTVIVAEKSNYTVPLKIIRVAAEQE